VVASQINYPELYKEEFNKLYLDSSYSAQMYYEASKSSEIWGRAIVFIPALLAATASLLVILGLSRLWGVAGAVSAIVSATSSYLGAGHRASTFRECGNAFTKIRHEARMWRDTLVSTQSQDECLAALKQLRGAYATVVDKVELPNNRFFKKTDRRISEGVLDYAQDATD
jgi:hypothetical protein